MSNPKPWFVAIGASGAEGLGDMIALLCGLAKPVPAVVMAVLHRPSDKISHLRDVLANKCNLPVVVASEAEVLQSGICYIGEPDGHLTLIDRHVAHLVPGAGHVLRNRTVDTLFNSLAAHAAKSTIGVIVSGALDDGSRGLAAVHDAGGVTMVLNPGSKPRGMQQNAIEYDGPVNFIGTAMEIAQQVDEVLARKRCGT